MSRLANHSLYLQEKPNWWAAQMVGDGHSFVLCTVLDKDGEQVGRLAGCSKCGAYVQQRCLRAKLPCAGAPKASDMKKQLARLKASKHPGSDNSRLSPLGNLTSEELRMLAKKPFGLPDDKDSS
mmetsp:Transcript_59208/g.141382  ORF Transcript_59208/g.141382 Transcript_59208/m.141382 type:complete len:124 (-) Transcript_59208:419-790(-)